jgi:hypothetical protein
MVVAPSGGGRGGWQGPGPYKEMPLPCKYLIKVTYCKEMPLPWPLIIFFSCSTSGGTFNIIKTTNLPGIGLTIHMNNKIA